MGLGLKWILGEKMAYQSNIPQATDLLSQSQDDILNNFLAIAAAFNLNHGNFNAANQGKHNFVQMPAQSPAPTTGAGEVGLYCANSALSSQPELFFRKQSGSTAPVTNYEISSAGYSATDGWARLPSGILLKWGNGTQVTPGNFIVTYPVAATIPVFTATYTAILTPATTNMNLYLISIATTTLTVNSTSGLFRWLVIGV